MGLPTNYRWVAVGKISARNHVNSPDGAAEFTVADLFARLQATMGQQSGVRTYQNDERRMWCSPIEEGPHYLSLLVQVGDRTVADSAFVDFDTLATRDGGKLDTEGGHFCSHMIIKRNADPMGRHLVLLERVPGISLTTLRSHFNWHLSRPDAMKTADDMGVPKQYRGVVEMDGYQSNTLVQAMVGGTVLDVTFVGNQTLEQGVDEAPLVRELEKQMRWSVGRRVDRNAAQALIEQGFDFVRGWEDVEDHTKQFLIRIKSNDGQVKTATVSADADDADDAAAEALEGAFILNEKITEFAIPLTQRYDGLREDVLTKLRERAAVVEGR